MIEYLIKKLQGEEQQRLRTEIQSSRMISSLEKVIQQLVSKLFIGSFIEFSIGREKSIYKKRFISNISISINKTDSLLMKKIDFIETYLKRQVRKYFCLYYRCIFLSLLTKRYNLFGYLLHAYFSIVIYIFLIYSLFIY